jgi:flagellar motor switch protein FliG
MKRIASLEELSGVEKASVAMLALGEEHATRLFTLLDREEVLTISRALATLGEVEAEVVERLLEEFDQRLARAASVAGGLEATERLLLRSLGAPQGEAILTEVRTAAARTVWDRLTEVDEAALAAFLASEYPQTVAVVLSRIEPGHAARVLARLPDALASEVVVRVLAMEPVQEDIVAEVERSLRVEFVSGPARAGRQDRHALLAEIFNHLDKASETRLIQALEDLDVGSAERVRTLMFTFESLIRVSASGIQALVRAAGNERLALALKGASEPLRMLFFKNMSERAAKILREEMEARGPVRLKDVEEAQRFLVALAKELAASGQILLADAADEPLVY